MKRIWISLSLAVMLSMAPAQVMIDLQLLHPTAEIFPVGDLGFLEASQTQPYFIATIENTASDPITIALELAIELNGIVIAFSESAPFDVPPGIPYTFNSLQLVQGVALVGSTFIDMGDYTVRWEAVGNLEDQVLSTGRLPAGEYDFILLATDLESGSQFTDPTPDNNRLSISNPTTLELIFPGRSVGEERIPEVAVLFPYFQWVTDAPQQSGSYNITVYRKHPQDQTPLDVLSHPPVLQVTGLQQNFFQYPTSSTPDLLNGTVQGPIRPLEFGNTYYWKVESIVPSAGGNPLVLSSEVFRFRISNLATSGTNSEQILAFLEQLLGTEHGTLLTDLIEQGYEPEGTISVNGTDVDIQSLLETINKVLSGQAGVISAEVY